MEKLQKTVGRLLERVSCLEESNRQKDGEIRSLQTDLRNLYSRPFASGDLSLDSERSSFASTSSSLETTPSATTHSNLSDVTRSESVVETTEPAAVAAFQDIEERVGRLERLVNPGGGRIHSEDVAATQSPAPGSRDSDARRSKDVSSRLDMLQDAMDFLTHRVTSMQNVNETFDARLQDWEGKAERVEVTLNELQERMNLMTRRVSSIENVHKVVGTRPRESDERVVQLEDCVQEMLQQLADDRQNAASRLDRVEEGLRKSQADVNDQFQIASKDVENIQEKLLKNKRKISDLKKWQDTMSQAAFHVKLREGTALIPNIDVQLDLCEVVRLGDNCFDRQTAFFEAPSDGIYFFSLLVCQHNYGRLQVAVGPDVGETFFMVHTYVTSTGFYIGTTRDTRSGCAVMRLTQGQRVGVFVRRLRGQAEVEWCHFTGCLLASSACLLPELHFLSNARELSGITVW